MGNIATETALKALIVLMKKGNISEGKSLILKEAHSTKFWSQIIMAVKQVHSYVYSLIYGKHKLNKSAQNIILLSKISMLY